MINLLNCNNETLTPARQAGEAGRRRFRPDVPEGVGSHLAQLDPLTTFAPQKHVERRTESVEMLLFFRMLYIDRYRRRMKKPCVSDHSHCRGVCPGKLHRFHHSSNVSALPLNILCTLYLALNKINNVKMS